MLAVLAGDRAHFVRKTIVHFWQNAVCPFLWEDWHLLPDRPGRLVGSGWILPNLATIIRLSSKLSSIASIIGFQPFLWIIGLSIFLFSDSPQNIALLVDHVKTITSNDQSFQPWLVNVSFSYLFFQSNRFSNSPRSLSPYPTDSVSETWCGQDNKDRIDPSKPQLEKKSCRQVWSVFPFDPFPIFDLVSVTQL